MEYLEHFVLQIESLELCRVIGEAIRCGKIDVSWLYDCEGHTGTTDTLRGICDNSCHSRWDNCKCYRSRIGWTNCDRVRNGENPSSWNVGHGRVTRSRQPGYEGKHTSRRRRFPLLGTVEGQLEFLSATTADQWHTSASESS